MTYQEATGDAVTPHIALALPSEPTRQQKCVELAQAIGWRPVHANSHCLITSVPKDQQVIECWFGPDGKSVSLEIPDYFTDHEACHALLSWFRKQPGDLRGLFTEELESQLYAQCDDGERSIWLFLTAPIETVATAAFLALRKYAK